LNDKIKFIEHILEFIDSDFTLHVFLPQHAPEIELTGPCIHGVVLAGSHNCQPAFPLNKEETIWLTGIICGLYHSEPMALPFISSSCVRRCSLQEIKEACG
jgi:hypothetical protein